jgi:hypothetical protein
MTRVEFLISGLVVLLVAALGYYFFFGVPFLPRGQIEGFDKLIVRVGEAAASGRVAPGLETPVCQTDAPKHIGELAQDVLDSKPALECGSELQPAAALAQPVTIVDFDKKQIDSINETLPDPLRAPNLGAAATIAFIHCSKRKTGSYGFFRDAFAQECNVLFVAAKGPSGMQILGLAFFRSPAPKKIDTRFSFFGDIVADRPDFDMRYYIVSRFAGAAEPENPSATR